MSDFDPLAILAALERHHVAYVLVGDLAGVLHGTDLTADSVEITPSLKHENSERLEHALEDLGVSSKRRARLQALLPDTPSISFSTARGDLRLTPTPTGTTGYDDLRRAAQREPLGQGVRAPVVSAPDLLRAVSAGSSDPVLEQRLRRLVDLERTLTPEI